MRAELQKDSLFMARNLPELARLQVAEILEDISNYPKTSPLEKVSQLVSLFGKTGVYEMVVTDGNKHALVTLRDVLKVVHPERTSIASIGISSHLKVASSTRLYDAATLLFNNRVRVVPVVEDRTLAGVVSQQRILQNISDCEDLHEFVAEELMAKNLRTVEHNASIGVARSIMLREGISHLPVLGRDNRLFGLITAKDLVLNFVKPQESTKVGERAGERLNWTKMTISGLADRHPLEATRRTKISHITKDMIEKNRNCCIIVEDSRAVGVITPRDILSLLKQFKPKFQVPLYIVGVESIDEDQVDSAKRKIERVVIRGLKLHPDIREIIVHGKVTPSHLGGRRRIELTARVYTDREVFGATAEHWSSFQNVADDLCERLDKRLRIAKGYRKKLVRRPKHIRSFR